FRFRRLPLGARDVPACELRDRIDDLLMSASTDGEDGGRPLTRADENVIGPGGAMDEIPLLQRAFLTLDQQQGLAEEDKEVLLCRLAVIQAGRLPGREHADIDPELRELGLALDRRAGAEGVVLDPTRPLGVDDEP